MIVSVLLHVWLISGISIFGERPDAVRTVLSVSLFAKAKKYENVTPLLPRKVEHKTETKPVEKKRIVHKAVSLKEAVIIEEKVKEEVDVTSADEVVAESASEPITEVVREPVAPIAQVNAEPAVVEVSTPPFDREAYNKAVRSIIAANKVYPLIAKRRGIEGTVLTSFTILTDGSVSGLYLEKASGFSQLDNAAYSIIKKSSPFPPPPERDQFLFTRDV